MTKYICTPYYLPRSPPLLSLEQESVASVFQKMQFDKSIGAHTWELGAMLRSACIIPFGIGLFL